MSAWGRPEGTASTLQQLDAEIPRMPRGALGDFFLLRQYRGTLAWVIDEGCSVTARRRLDFPRGGCPA